MGGPGSGRRPKVPVRWAPRVDALEDAEDRKIVATARSLDRLARAHPFGVESDAWWAAVEPRLVGEERHLWRKAAAIVMLQRGWTHAAIGERLGGMKRLAVANMLSRLRRRGVLGDAEEVLDTVAVPLAVENVVAGVAEGSETYTLATLRGRGQLRAHVAGAGAAAAVPTSLTVVFQMPGGEARGVFGGQVVGVARGAVAALPAKDEGGGA